MQTIRIEGVDYHMPTPVYILPETVEMTEDSLTAQCLFPSSDPSIGDRVDHANIGSALFAAWNCSHIWRQKNGRGRLLAIKTHQQAFGKIPPDQKIDVFATIKLEDGSHIGSGEVIFSHEGRRLLLVSVDKLIEEEAGN